MAELREDVKAKLFEAIATFNQLARTDREERWTWTHPGNRWVRLDCETGSSRSGAFLVDAATGELYNIKGYGTPDHNKKAKADLGNILTANLATVYGRRWNYLR